MTLHSKTCSTKHIERKPYHSLREDLSVSLSSSSMFDGTGRPVGDRNSEAQIGALLDDQEEQNLAEYQGRSNQHEFQAARAEEEQRLLQGQLLQQKFGISWSSSTEMEELRKFQSSAFRHNCKDEN